MTDTTTQAVTALLDGVTPGPWAYNTHREVGPMHTGDDQAWGMICDPVCEVNFSATHMGNARFIAAARDLVPALLAERDALAAQLAAAEARAREASLDALAAYGQAADAHAAQLAAEQRLATCEKYRDAYGECDRIGADAVRAMEAKVAQVESLTRGQAEQLEIQGNTIIRINGRAESAEAKLATARGALETAQHCIATFIGVNGYPADSPEGQQLAEVDAAIRALAKGDTPAR